MKMLWMVCAAGLLFPVTVFAQAGGIPGDINRDGKVDFKDFIILAQNFGRESEPPTGSEVTVVRDTAVMVTAGDSLEQLVITTSVWDPLTENMVTSVADTVYQLSEQALGRQNRAQRLLGFWTFKWGEDDADHFILGSKVDPPDINVPISVLGASNTGVIVSCSWDSDQQLYVLWYRPDLETPPRVYAFALDEKDQASGTVVEVHGTAGNLLGPLTEGSGRNDTGEGFRRNVESGE